MGTQETLTQVLKDEHKLILRMIRVLEVAAGRLEAPDPPPPEVFETAVDFIRTFADRFHHAKEEDVLFRELVANGMPEKASPIEAMLIEHDQGRAFVRGVLDGTQALRRGEPDAAATIEKNALGYVGLLREHIEKEDEILYPLSERVLPAEAQTRAREDFRKAERAKGGGDLVRKYEALVLELEESCGIGTPSDAAPEPAGVGLGAATA